MSADEASVAAAAAQEAAAVILDEAPGPGLARRSARARRPSRKVQAESVPVVPRRRAPPLPNPSPLEVKREEADDLDRDADPAQDSETDPSFHPSSESEDHDSDESGAGSSASVVRFFRKAPGRHGGFPFTEAVLHECGRRPYDWVRLREALIRGSAARHQLLSFSQALQLYWELHPRAVDKLTEFLSKHIAGLLNGGAKNNWDLFFAITEQDPLPLVPQSLLPQVLQRVAQRAKVRKLYRDSGDDAIIPLQPDRRSGFRSSASSRPASSGVAKGALPAPSGAGR
jgi:hypothetical protein